MIKLRDRLNQMAMGRHIQEVLLTWNDGLVQNKESVQKKLHSDQCIQPLTEWVGDKGGKEETQIKRKWEDWSGQPSSSDSYDWSYF